jgi:hypothetical protein
VEDTEHVDSWQICRGEKGNQAFTLFSMCNVKFIHKCDSLVFFTSAY